MDSVRHVYIVILYVLQVQVKTNEMNVPGCYNYLHWKLHTSYIIALVYIWRYKNGCLTMT